LKISKIWLLYIKECEFGGEIGLDRESRRTGEACRDCWGLVKHRQKNKRRKSRNSCLMQQGFPILVRGFGKTLIILTACILKSRNMQ